MKQVRIIIYCILSALFLTGCFSITTDEKSLPVELPVSAKELRLGKVFADRIKAGKNGGCSLQCVYRLEAPYAEVWKQKTNFDNLTGSSGTITESRIISRTPEKIVYEAKNPQLSKWLKTQIDIDVKNLTISITMLNPDEMGMIFMNSKVTLKPDGYGTIVYWRNDLSLVLWPDSVAASIMLPKMKETALEDCRLFRQIMELKRKKPHPNYINPRI